ncbi:MAG TPA: sigma-70 family RNA polymerase sigma factor [Chitinophagaceae bacterium]|jgi:RNA polymerase sigma factor (sigma-70 family)|nr:sigma-70 family RNA polymerase sigma factor [Bacteroidota bacterium]HQW46864.1 sigma-70 family RNA polymerase sigma factor [Chitinophagaceae bacterium]
MRFVLRLGKTHFYCLFLDFYKKRSLITEQIIQGCLQNDRKSQRLLYESCFAVLMKVCRRYISNEEEVLECMNTSFMKILKNLSSLKDDKSLYGWAKQIAVNTAIDFYRNKKKYTDHNKFTIDTDYSNVEQTHHNMDFTESMMDSREIFKLIQELPEVTRQVLNLFAIDGYNHKEVGNMLGLSEEASRWHLHKARKLMTLKLEKLNFAIK